MRYYQFGIVHRLHRFTQIIYFLVKFEQFILDIIYIFVSLKQSTIQTINLIINIDSPTGRRLLKEVERYPKVAKVEYPVSKTTAGEKNYTLEESYEECCDILSEHYKCDVRKF